MTSVSCVLSLPRPSLKRPLQVFISTLRNAKRAVGFGASGAVAALFVSDPGSGPVTSAIVLQALYGLTPAEGRLAHQLATGASLEEAAARLGLRLETVRSRLKVIFQKTDTHRQADLVRLILSTPDLSSAL